MRIICQASWRKKFGEINYRRSSINDAKSFERGVEGSKIVWLQLYSLNTIKHDKIVLCVIVLLKYNLRVERTLKLVFN